MEETNERENVNVPKTVAVEGTEAPTSEESRPTGESVNKIPVEGEDSTLEKPVLELGETQSLHQKGEGKASELNDKTNESDTVSLTKIDEKVEEERTTNDPESGKFSPQNEGKISVDVVKDQESDNTTPCDTDSQKDSTAIDRPNPPEESLKSSSEGQPETSVAEAQVQDSSAKESQIDSIDVDRPNSSKESSKRSSESQPETSIAEDSSAKARQIDSLANDRPNPSEESLKSSSEGQPETSVAEAQVQDSSAKESQIDSIDVDRPNSSKESSKRSSESQPETSIAEDSSAKDRQIDSLANDRPNYSEESSKCSSRQETAVTEATVQVSSAKDNQIDPKVVEGTNSSEKPSKSSPENSDAEAKHRDSLAKNSQTDSVAVDRRNSSEESPQSSSENRPGTSKLGELKSNSKSKRKLDDSEETREAKEIMIDTEEDKESNRFDYTEFEQRGSKFGMKKLKVVLDRKKHKSADRIESSAGCSQQPGPKSKKTKPFNDTPQKPGPKSRKAKHQDVSSTQMRETELHESTVHSCSEKIYRYQKPGPKSKKMANRQNTGCKLQKETKSVTEIETTLPSCSKISRLQKPGPKSKKDRRQYDNSKKVKDTESEHTKMKELKVCLKRFTDKAHQKTESTSQLKKEQGQDKSEVSAEGEKRLGDSPESNEQNISSEQEESRNKEESTGANESSEENTPPSQIDAFMVAASIATTPSKPGQKQENNDEESLSCNQKNDSHRHENNSGIKQEADEDENVDSRHSAAHKTENNQIDLTGLTVVEETSENDTQENEDKGIETTVSKDLESSAKHESSKALGESKQEKDDSTPVNELKVVLQRMQFQADATNKTTKSCSENDVPLIEKRAQVESTEAKDEEKQSERSNVSLEEVVFNDIESFNAASDDMNDSSRDNSTTNASTSADKGKLTERIKDGEEVASRDTDAVIDCTEYSDIGSDVEQILDEVPLEFESVYEEEDLAPGTENDSNSATNSSKLATYYESILGPIPGEEQSKSQATTRQKAAEGSPKSKNQRRKERKQQFKEELAKNVAVQESTPAPAPQPNKSQRASMTSQAQVTSSPYTRGPKKRDALRAALKAAKEAAMSLPKAPASQRAPEETKQRAMDAAMKAAQVAVQTHAPIMPTTADLAQLGLPTGFGRKQQDTSKAWKSKVKFKPNQAEKEIVYKGTVSTAQLASMGLPTAAGSRSEQSAGPAYKIPRKAAGGVAENAIAGSVWASTYASGQLASIPTSKGNPVPNPKENPGSSRRGMAPRQDRRSPKRSLDSKQRDRSPRRRSPASRNEKAKLPVCVHEVRGTAPKTPVAKDTRRSPVSISDSKRDNPSRSSRLDLLDTRHSRSPFRRSSPRRSPLRRSSPRRSSPRRSPLRRSSPRRSSPRRSSPRRSPARRSSPRRSSPRRSPTRRSSPRRSSPRRSPTRRSSPRRSSPRRSPTRRSSPGRSSPRRSPVRRISPYRKSPASSNKMDSAPGSSNPAGDKHLLDTKRIAALRTELEKKKASLIELSRPNPIGKTTACKDQIMKTVDPNNRDQSALEPSGPPAVKVSDLLGMMVGTKQNAAEIAAAWTKSTSSVSSSSLPKPKEDFLNPDSFDIPVIKPPSTSKKSGYSRAHSEVPVKSHQASRDHVDLDKNPELYFTGSDRWQKPDTLAKSDMHSEIRERPQSLELPADINDIDFGYYKMPEPYTLPQTGYSQMMYKDPLEKPNQLGSTAAAPKSILKSSKSAFPINMNIDYNAAQRRGIEKHPMPVAATSQSSSKPNVPSILKPVQASKTVSSLPRPSGIIPFGQKSSSNIQRGHPETQKSNSRDSQVIDLTDQSSKTEEYSSGSRRGPLRVPSPPPPPPFIMPPFQKHPGNLPAKQSRSPEDRYQRHKSPDRFQSSERWRDMPRGSPGGWRRSPPPQRPSSPPRRQSSPPPSELQSKKPRLESQSRPAASRNDSDDLQVAICSNRPTGEVLPQEAARIKSYIVQESVKAMQGPTGGPRGPPLRFTNSKRCDEGWFLITPLDSVAQNWLLRILAPLRIGNLVFKPMKAADAPWPTLVEMLVTTPQLDVQRLLMMLDLQNPTLRMKDWKHLTSKGRPGGWIVTFSVVQEVVDALEECDWTLWYELDSIRVRRAAQQKPRGGS
ncbi:unnamed protein product [Acanthoscelides obtectus]|uniref:DUF4780 domain-containing protein n=1 Tax=Acanthoscelides obtectus TaxID=200917 RepID=A0A9P0K6L5_ACAOB|nr:unnamed protein product [Acanthoscelides obtectus]CAK1676686.1 Transmembrane protease serine 13 [Acanthoscelides obtectus]